LLVVEREESLLALLCDIVDDAGFRAIPVRSLAAAPELVAANSGNVVVVAFTDDRYKLASLARQAPVVALADSNWCWSATALGVRCLLPVPFDLEELEQALRTCLKQAQHVAPPVGALDSAE
jgi:DNA-binding response OmpR family regulator